jgi:hypothetical protein
MCVEGSDLVFENDCGCNDELICHLDRAEHATLYLSLRKDPTRIPRCRDCFPMIPGRCAIPAAPSDVVGRTWTIVINRQASLELPIDGAGKAPDGSCWTGD